MARRARSDEILDLARRLELAAEDIDAVVAAACDAAERIRERERLAGAALTAGRGETLRGRIGAEAVNSALDRVNRIGYEAESLSATLKRAAGAFSGRARPRTIGEGGPAAGDLSLRQMTPRKQALDRSP